MATMTDRAADKAAKATAQKIDWSGVQILDSANRRVSVWLPEIDGEQA